GLHQAALHVEGTGAVGFACFDPERHRRKSATGVDGVIVAENHQLALWTDAFGLPRYSEVITTVLLCEALDASAALAPFFREQRAATVCGSLFEAGRFALDEAAELGEHAVNPGSEGVEKHL